MSESMNDLIYLQQFSNKYQRILTGTLYKNTKYIYDIFSFPTYLYFEKERLKSFKRTLRHE